MSAFQVDPKTNINETNAHSSSHDGRGILPDASDPFKVEGSLGKELRTECIIALKVYDQCRHHHCI